MVTKICWYGSTDSHKGQPYSMAGITLEYTNGDLITLGRTDGKSGSSCLTLDIDNGEVFTGIQINNIDDTNGDIDQVFLQTNKQVRVLCTACVLECCSLSPHTPPTCPFVVLRCHGLAQTTIVFTRCSATIQLVDWYPSLNLIT